MIAATHMSESSGILLSSVWQDSVSQWNTHAGAVFNWKNVFFVYVYNQECVHVSKYNNPDS